LDLNAVVAWRVHVVVTLSDGHSTLVQTQPASPLFCLVVLHGLE